MENWSILLRHATFSGALTGNGWTFSSLGEFIDPLSFKVDVALNKVRTFQMKVRLDNVLAPYLAVNSTSEPLYLEVTRNGVMLFNGPLVTMQEVGEENTASLQINAAGPESIFAQRLAATAAAEQIAGLKLAGGVERAKRFVELLQKSEQVSGSKFWSSWTHIDSTTGPISSTANGAYESASFRTLAETLVDMYNQAEGFDWAVIPTVPTEGNIGRLKIQDIIGTPQNGAVFEWGGGRNNVSKFNRTVDLTNLANRAWNVSSAGPEAIGSPTVKKENAEAIEKWRLREAMVPLSALSIPLREAITQEALNYRKQPKQTIAFEPSITDSTGRVPQFEKDFGLGDFIPLRILYNGVQHLNALVRCWGASYSVEDNKETQTILTSEE